MIVPGQAGAIRRFHVPRVWFKRAAWAGIALSIALLVFSVDYVRVRMSLSELERLRGETTAQREELLAYAQKMETISTRLGKIDGFERKLRVITNLDPADPLPLPGIGGTSGELLDADDVSWLSRAKRHEIIQDGLETLADAAETQEQSLRAPAHAPRGPAGPPRPHALDRADTGLGHVVVRLSHGARTRAGANSTRASTSPAARARRSRRPRTARSSTPRRSARSAMPSSCATATASRPSTGTSRRSW